MTKDEILNHKTPWEIADSVKNLIASMINEELIEILRDLKAREILNPIAKQTTVSPETKKCMLLYMAPETLYLYCAVTIKIFQRFIKEGEEEILLFFERNNKKLVIRTNRPDYQINTETFDQWFLENVLQ